MFTRRLAPFLAVLTTLASVPLVLGYWGRVHPAFDSLAHFRLHCAALLLVFAVPLVLARGWRRIGAMGAALALATMSATLLPATGAGPAAATPGDAGPARYRLLQLNLRYDNPTPKRVFALIGRTRPDVITLDEVSAMWREELKALEAAYPHRLICPPPAHIGGVAILSRRPFRHPSMTSCADRGAIGLATVDFGGAAVDVAALHLGWPWPFGQHRQIARVAPSLNRLGASAILAGDFNAAPWSVTARRVATAGGLTPLGGIGPTWMTPFVPEPLWRLAGLPIDQIMTKGRVVPLSVRRLEPVGSDHLPVMLEFGIVPTGGEAEVLQARAR